MRESEAVFVGIDVSTDHLDVAVDGKPEVRRVTNDEAGIQALQAGAHVMVEKPITLTVREGRDLINAARTHGRKLSVAENYRRDPINRLARALIDAGALGRVFFAIQSSSGSGERVIITPWRHLRSSCGIGIDMGVHYADILEYLLGPVECVAGMGDVVDVRRRDTDGNWHDADAEDLLLGIARFRSGALANLVLNLAGRGETHYQRIVYGTAGSLSIPRDRTGEPLVLTLRENGQERTLSGEDQLRLVPDFALDDTTAALFGGERLTSYVLDWADVDANLLAIEHDDFARAILDDREPEVTGEAGLRSLALIYGFLESERLGRFLSMDELLTGEDAPYQLELTASGGQGD